MIIDLPERFTHTNKNGEKLAYIDEERILEMKNCVSFKGLMKEITYAIKGSKICYYCGKKLKEGEVSPDHAIPQDIGGPTIPNNLYPSCSACNSEKSNLLLQQYLEFRTIDDGRERKEYRKKCLSENELLKHISLSKLLGGDMVTYMQLSDIKLLKAQRKHTEYHYKKYAEIERFYEIYNRLKKPIIVDRNLKLLGGFISLMFAKEHGIKTVPVIILENVEIIK